MKPKFKHLPTLAALVSSLLLTNLTPARAAVYLWNAAAPGANNWNDTANWLPATGNPGAADTAIFGATGTGSDAFTINNVVSINTTVTALNFTNTTAATWHVTQIPAGMTLTVTNLTVGFGAAANGLVTSAAVLDAGTLQVNGNLTIGNNGSSSADTGTILDLSGLSNFVYTAASGTIALSTGNRSAANMKLAAISNNITAGTMNLNTASSSSSATGTFTLGAGTNIINVGAWNQAAARNNCTVQFPAGAAGGLRLRGVGGTDADLATMTIGNHNNSGGSSSAATGNLALNGFPVDIRAGILTLGRNQNGTATGTDTGSGTLSFDTGTVFATTVLMAITTTANANSIAIGTINLGANATLFVGTGGLSLVNRAGGTATGNLNISGGTLICSNSITKANTSGTGNITLTGGGLTLAGGTIGTEAVPIDTLSLGDAALTLAVTANTTNAFVNTLTTTSTTNNTINITALPVILSYPAQYALIKYGSYSPVLDSDFLPGSLPAGSPAYAGFISNNVVNGTLDLVITNGPVSLIQSLVWNGNVNGNWDLTTANWQGSKIYQQNDNVLFDDTASGTTNINLTTTLAPGGLTVSNITRGYVFSGAGNLDGAITLNKDGAGTLTIANSGVNTFSNGVSILGGTVLLSGGADRLPTGSIVTLADVAGATLDLNGNNQTLRSLNGGGFDGGNVTLGSATLTDWTGGTFGGVISGSGQLIKTNLPGTAGGTLTLTNENTYSGGTIIGGYTNNTTVVVANLTGSGTGSGFVRVLTNGSLYIGNGGPNGSVGAGVITNDGTVRLNRGEDFTFTNVIVGAGVVQIQNTNSVTIASANFYTGGTLISLGSLRVGNSGALGSGTITIGNAAPAVLQLTNGVTVANPLSIVNKPSGSGAVPNVENLGGSNTLSGPIQLTQNGAIGWLFNATAGHLLISGSTLAVSPANTSQNGSRTLWLRGDADGEWSGSINDTVNSITNVNVRKDGLGTWVLSGANGYSGATVVSNGTLLVNGSLAASASVTVAGGTLGGSGTIASPVTVSDVGSLAPGTAIGTLTVNNDLTLNGAAVMEVSHAAADRVSGINTLTLGGTLQVVVNGNLTGGEVFKLFAATNYTGDFTTYDLPVLSAPLGWDYSSIPVDGTLKVTGGAPSIVFSQAGNVLTFSWADANYHLQSQTNALSTGLGGTWFDFPGGAGSPVNVTIDPANPAVFFRLSQ